MKNSFMNSLNELDFYFTIFFCGILAVQLIAIIFGLKFRSKGYKIFLAIISVLMLIPTFFCFQNELRFYLMGTLFTVSVLAGLLLSLPVKKTTMKKTAFIFTLIFLVGVHTHKTLLFTMMEMYISEMDL